jgi:hypothetical protein
MQVERSIIIHCSPKEVFAFIPNIELVQVAQNVKFSRSIDSSTHQEVTK